MLSLIALASVSKIQWGANVLFTCLGFWIIHVLNVCPYPSVPLLSRGFESRDLGQGWLWTAEGNQEGQLDVREAARTTSSEREENGLQAVYRFSPSLHASEETTLSAPRGCLGRWPWRVSVLWKLITSVHAVDRTAYWLWQTPVSLSGFVITHSGGCN